MAATEDIITVVIIVSIALVVGILIMSQYGQISLDKDRYWAQYEIEDAQSATFNTLLGVTEVTSRRNFGDLLGSAVYFRQDRIETADSPINVSKQFARLLDTYYPEGNYYFEADAGLDSMELFFIVDGKDTMKDDMLYLSRNLDRINASLSEEFKVAVKTKVYIINLENSTWCDNFKVPCAYMDSETLYVNQSFSNFDLKKYEYKLFRPDHWLVEDAWKSDWQTAMAVIAITEVYSNLTSFRVALPLTDTLPGGSQYFNPCPKVYAENILVRDRPLLEKANYIIDPILSTNSDPILYCDDYIIHYMDRLIANNNGVVIMNRDNFAARLPSAIRENINKGKIQIGKRSTGKAYTLERSIPMPNGKLGTARLTVYLK